MLSFFKLAGPAPLSEPENFFYNELIKRYNSQIRLFIALHTFGDLGEKKINFYLIFKFNS
jgi:hypothetical protein